MILTSVPATSANTLTIIISGENFLFGSVHLQHPKLKLQITLRIMEYGIKLEPKIEIEISDR